MKNLKKTVKTFNPIKKSKKKKILDDGNYYYKCVSYFLLSDKSYFKEIKKEIVNWIEIIMKDL